MMMIRSVVVSMSSPPAKLREIWLRALSREVDSRRGQRGRDALGIFHGALLGRLDLRASGESAKEPERYENDEDQAENAAETPAAVAAMGVVTAAAAEQKDQYNNDQNRTHKLGLLRQVFMAPAASSVAVISSTPLAPRPSGRRRRSGPCPRPCRPCRRFAAWRRPWPCQSPPWPRPSPLLRRRQSCPCPLLVLLVLAKRRPGAFPTIARSDFEGEIIARRALFHE